MFPARILSISINRPFDAVYAFAQVPENFMKWASGLAATLRKAGDVWIADTPDGKAKVRFSPPNAYGVLDHWVAFPDSAEIYIPLRVIANGEGSEVSLTLFRLPEMDDKRFERDAAMVEEDLATLKAVLEAGPN